jgi:hypothetical protein
VFGDGSIFRAYSDVRLVRDAATGLLVPVGSRAKDPRRAHVQLLQRQRGADGKQGTGINHVALYTWTPNGCVVLAVDRALGGEALVLVPMVDAVAEAAGDGFHTLVYDRVVQVGWITDHLMAAYGIDVVNKAVARAVQRDEISAVKWLEQCAQSDAIRLRRKPLSKDQLPLEMTRLAGEMLRKGHLPPGVSIYPTSTGFDVIDSAFHRFTEAHDVDGRVHRDRLILDDQALFLQDEAGNKGAFCPPLRSTRELTPAGTWARRTKWRIPCSCGEWMLEKVWAPADRRAGHARGGDGLTAQRLLAHMRPAPRLSDGFAIHHRRSTAEGRNHITKDRLAHYGRAAHLDPNRQMLDFLAAARIVNAETWQRHPDARDPWRPGRG